MLYEVITPYKIDIIEYLDFVSDEVKKIGALNTVKFGDVVKGYNTDYFGVVGSFEKFEVDINGKTAVILGAGGAARAVVAALLDSGISEIFIVTRDVQEAGTKFLSYDKIKIIRYIDFQDINKKDT